MSTFLQDWLNRRAMSVPKAGGDGYIVFADPEVERVCIETFSSDGIGVKYSDVSQRLPSTIPGGLFDGNTLIESFDEFQYFTGYGLRVSDAYDDWDQRRPSKYAMFRDCTNLRSVVMPPNLLDSDNYMFSNCPSLTRLDVPENVSSLKDQFCSYSQNLQLVCHGETPPDFWGTAFWGSEGLKVYCPYSADHSIYAAYQTALSNVASMGTLYELNPDGTIPTT